MGAPDLASWVWPDAGLGRAPTAGYPLDLANPRLAGLADYAIPADASTYRITQGQLGLTIDQLGPAFLGDGRWYTGQPNAVETSEAFTLVGVMRMPAVQTGYQVAVTLTGPYNGIPYLGYGDTVGGVTVSGSNDGTSNNLGVVTVPGQLCVAAGVYTAAGVDAYVAGQYVASDPTAPVVGQVGVNGRASLFLMDYGGGGGNAYDGQLFAALAFNRALSAAELATLATPQDIFSLFEPAKLGIYVPQQAAITLPLTQVAATGAAGSVTAIASRSLTQVAASGAVQTVAPGMQYGLTQVAAAGADGSVASAFSRPLTQVAASGVVESVAAGMRHGLASAVAHGVVGQPVSSGGFPVAPALVPGRIRVFTATSPVNVLSIEPQPDAIGVTYKPD